MSYINPISRRDMLRSSAAAVLAGAAGVNAGWSQSAYAPHPANRIGQPQAAPDTPKITMYMQDLLDKAEARRLKQIGITWIDAANVPHNSPGGWTICSRAWTR